MDDRRYTHRSIGAVLGCCLAMLPACSTLPGQGGTTALSFMRQVREGGDPNLRYQAYAKLASPNCYDNEAQQADAARLMIAALEGDREPLATRALICQTLGSLHRVEARPALLKQLEESDPLVRAEALRALGKLGNPDDGPRLVRGIFDTQEDCRIASLDGLAALKPTDPTLRREIVEGMDHADPAIRYASLQTLRKIYGRDLGAEIGPWRKLNLDELHEAESKAQAAQRAAEHARPAAQPLKTSTHVDASRSASPAESAPLPLLP